MKRYISKISILVLTVVFLTVGCNENKNPVEPTSQFQDVLAKKGFVHGIVIDIDGEDYYFPGSLLG